MPRKRRVLTWVLGGAALALVLAALVYHEDFARHYHLWRLGSSPDALGEYLDAPEGSIEQRVTAEFLETRAGKIALAGLFAEWLRRDFGKMNVYRIKFGESREVARVIVVLGESNVWMGTSTVAGKMGHQHDSVDSLFRPAHYRALRKYLPEFPDEAIAIPELAHLKMGFLSFKRFRESIKKVDGDERALLPLDEIDMRAAEPNDPVCIVSPLGGSAVPALTASLKRPLRMARYAAARLIGDLRTEAAAAVPELRQLASDTDDKEFRGILERSIAKIEGKSSEKSD